MKHRLSATLGLIALTWALPARADETSVLSAARELAKSGMDDYDAGNFAEAAKKLGQAYSVVHVPTLALSRARALYKLGKWVSASELYLEAMKIPKDGSWQPVQLEAQRTAETERNDLLRHIPRLRLVIAGETSNSLRVEIDGTVIPPALLEAEQLLDPGTRTVRAARGKATFSQTVALEGGERKSMEIRLSAPEANGVTSERDSSVPATDGARNATVPTEPRSNVTYRTLGWIGISVGGAGLVAGVATGMLALSKRQTLKDSGACSADLRHCSEELSPTVDAYNTWRHASSIGFIAGGVIGAAGLTLLLSSPSKSDSSQVSLRVGPTHATLMGAF